MRTVRRLGPVIKRSHKPKLQARARQARGRSCQASHLNGEWQTYSSVVVGISERTERFHASGLHLRLVSMKLFICLFVRKSWSWVAGIIKNFRRGRLGNIEPCVDHSAEKPDVVGKHSGCIGQRGSTSRKRLVELRPAYPAYRSTKGLLMAAVFDESQIEQ